MSGVFVDTSVFLLAAGDPHPERDACRGFLTRARTQGVRLHVSVEAVQEFLFHRMRRTDRAAALTAARSMAAACVLHPFGEDVLLGALQLVETCPDRGRDAVHAAAATLAGFDTIVSLDHDFDQVPGLARLDPSVALD